MGVVYALSASAACVLVWQLTANHHLSRVVVWCVGGLLACLAVPITLRAICQHLVFYVSPLQRHYVRCLGLVPVYAIEGA